MKANEMKMFNEFDDNKICKCLFQAPIGVSYIQIFFTAVKKSKNDLAIRIFQCKMIKQNVKQFLIKSNTDLETTQVKRIRNVIDQTG